MSSLSIQHLTVTADSREIVRDVSLTLRAGEVSVLMGPNGSGKSTFVNALMGHPHYTVVNGAMLLDGEDITSLAPYEKARKGLFLSLQHVPKVGGITLATFLHKVHTATTGGQTDILEYYLTLRERAKEYDISEVFLNRPISAGLSGGEKKLSEVLQLAALKPRFAILDEVDSGVDVDALRTVFAAVKKLAGEGTGFLIISHHPSLLDHLTPDTVHVMSRGTLAVSGGVELVSRILREGFCKAIDCPLVTTCDARDDAHMSRAQEVRE